MNTSYTLVRSRRRTISLIVTNDARLEVRAPLRVAVHHIESFITKKSAWIHKTIERVAARPQGVVLSPDEIKAQKKIAHAIIPERVRVIAERFGISYRSVRITSAKSRWGSCSFDNRLNFAWRLAAAPLPVIDYVVAHELAHVRHKNHSPKFWELVETLCPDYRAHKRWLKDNGITLPH